MMQMMMPHSIPTRYEALDESLEALLNNGWSITQASGVGTAMALVQKRWPQHVICVLLWEQAPHGVCGAIPQWAHWVL
jgi:hypothetical protein